MARVQVWKQRGKEAELGWPAAPVVGVAFFTLTLFFPLSLSPISVQAQPAETASRGASTFTYTGTTPCAFSDCHGSVTATENPDRTIDQNEYFTWLKRDRHAKAYEVLQKERSVQIIKNLQLSENAAAQPRCLACHALSSSLVQYISAG